MGDRNSIKNPPTLTITVGGNRAGREDAAVIVLPSPRDDTSYVVMLRGSDGASWMAEVGDHSTESEARKAAEQIAAWAELLLRSYR